MKILGRDATEDQVFFAKEPHENRALLPKTRVYFGMQILWCMWIPEHPHSPAFLQKEAGIFCILQKSVFFSAKKT